MRPLEGNAVLPSSADQFHPEGSGGRSRPAAGSHPSSVTQLLSWSSWSAHRNRSANQVVRVTDPDSLAGKATV